MRRAKLLILCCWAFATAGSASATAADGALQPLSFPKLDDVRVAPTAQLSGYRAVILDAPHVTFAQDWLGSMNRTRERSRWLTARDAQRLADGFAADMSRTFAQMFQARGYDVVNAAGPGVLRISLHVADLYLNEVDLKTANDRRAFTRQSAGDATLVLDVSDSVRGTVLAHIVDRATARQLGPGFELTNDVSNSFWINAMFSRWAAATADALRWQADQPVRSR